MKLFTFALIALALTACSDSTPQAEPTPAPQTEYPAQGTVIDTQAKALNDAKKVEQQQIDAAAERMKAADGN